MDRPNDIERQERIEAYVSGKLGGEDLRAFELALSRPPTSEELATMRSFLKQHKGPFPDAVTDLCHSLLNLNEFLYVD